jgi:hypothetical protein
MYALNEIVAMNRTASSARRQYRKGAIEARSTRGAKQWEIERDTKRAMYGEYRIADIDMGANDTMGIIFHGAGERSIRRILASQQEFFCSSQAWDDFIALIHSYVNMTRDAQRRSNIPTKLTWNFQSTIAQVEIADIGVDNI